jgi:transposase
MPIKKRPRRLKIDIELTPTDIQTLNTVIKQGNHNVRIVTRARILLLSHAGMTNAEIVAALSCAPRMICTIRQRYKCDTSIMRTLADLPRSGQPRKITERHEAYVVATACTTAPQGHNHWTLPELKKALLKRYKTLKTVSDERIRHILLASELKPWREKNVVHS